MRGLNEVWIAGNIGGKIIRSTTKDNRPACSWAIASEDDKRRLTWVRINAYDDLAEYCMDRLSKGIYCSVVGELMNRGGQHGELTEVRAQQVVFWKSQDQDDSSDHEFDNGLIKDDYK